MNHQFFRSCRVESCYLFYTCVCVYIYTHVHSLSAYCPRRNSRQTPIWIWAQSHFSNSALPVELLCTRNEPHTKIPLPNNIFYACVHSCSVIHLTFSRKMNVLSIMHFPVRTSNRSCCQILIHKSWLTWKLNHLLENHRIYIIKLFQKQDVSFCPVISHWMKRPNLGTKTFKSKKSTWKCKLFHWSR